MAIVIISDARYVNHITGETHQSTKYHLPNSSCIQPDSSHYLEVEEDTAQAFGRTLCGTCINSRKRQKAQQVIEKVLSEMFPPSSESVFSQIANALPPNVEMRLYWHDPDKQHPKKIWSSIPDVPTT